MSEKLSADKEKKSLFDSISIRGAGTSIRFIKNIASKTVGALSEKFVFTSARSYGAMGLAYGLMSLFLYFGKNYYLNIAEPSPASLIIGIVFSLISVPLIFFDKPICTFLQDFFLTDFIIFEFFAIKRMDKSDAVPGVPILPAAVIGFVPALLGLFIQPLYVLAVVGLAVFVSIAIVTPEFPIIFTFLVAPYLSPIPDTGLVLACLSLLSFISFALKVAMGKRAYNFEIYDALFFILSIFFIIGGAVNNDIANSLVMVALTFAYIPISNIIVNRRLADRAVSALIVSSLPISLFSLVVYILSIFGKAEFDAAVVFASTDSYAAFLFLAFVFSCCFAKEKKNRIKKVVYFAVAVLHFVNIIFAWNIGLWLSTLMSLLAYLIIRTKNQRKEFLLLLLALPYLLFLLPDGFFEKISEFFNITPSFGEMFGEWSVGLEIFRENLLFGVGFGTKTPLANAFLAIGMNFGLVVLAIIVVIFIMRLIQLSEYGIYMRNSLLSLITRAGALAIFGIFAMGMYIDVFSDITIYLIFISIFGILSASLRISKSEYLDHLSYYGDQRSADSSDINIRIS